MGDCEVFRVRSDLERLKTKFNGFVSSVDSCEPVKSILTSEAVSFAEYLKKSDAVGDEYLDVEDDALLHGTRWCLDEDPLEVELTVPAKVAVSDLVRSLKMQTRILPMISTQTFVRPKKARTSLNCLVETNPPPSSSPGPKLRRRLTTTIDPSPGLIPHLQHLAKDGNRPVSANGEEELRWEDGAADAEAESALNLTPRSSRPAVPASLLQRLQELKRGNAVRPSKQEDEPITPNFKVHSPLRPPTTSSASSMSVSQLLREIPDPDSVEMESFLSLGGASLIESLDGSLDSDRRLTFGGMLIPNPKRHGQGNTTIVQTANLIHVNDALNSTFTMEEDFGSGDKGNVTVTNCTFDVNQGDDENRNHDVQKAVNKLLGYSSKIFDSSFGTKREARDGMRTFTQTNELLNSINKSRMTAETTIEDHKQLDGGLEVAERLQDETVPVTHKTETKKLEYSSATYSRAHRGSLLTTFRDGIPRSPFFKSQESLLGKTSRTSSRDNLERSPARSEDGVRGNLSRAEVSRETLILSPAPSDVAIDGYHGTYTRNSPVERCASEDEQMSTTSDHSTRSRESVDDIPNVSAHESRRKKYHVSTPILSESSRQSDDWQVSPIIARAKTSVTPIRTNGHAAPGSIARRLGKTPVGPGPIKQPLIQPTDNFRRPIIKKFAPSASIRNPTKPEPLALRNATRSETSQFGTARPSLGGSNLPKPSKLPGRLPVRTSSIPQPNSRPRPSVSK